MRLDLELPTETRTILLDPAEVGRTLTDVLRREHLPLNTRCGERQLCRSCGVEVLRNGEWVAEQACQVRLNQDLTVRIPQFAMLAYTPQVLADYRINIPYAHAPLLGTVGWAVAIDIGTTTVALSLVELASGEVGATTTAFNRQMHWGDDVLTRINLCLLDPAMTATLQRAIVVETLVPLLTEACEKSSVHPDAIRGFFVAGNTTMLHILAGVNPGPMGTAPFPPAFLDHRVLDSATIGLQPAGRAVHLLPSIAAYVGSDIVGGILASGLLYDDGPSLLVDAGTNGEIVLKDGDRLTACATAAGPAFEGSGLRGGMRAGEGAIAHVSVQESPFAIVTEVIGGAQVKPAGICGSAYIDFLAEGLRSGLLGANGRMREGEGRPLTRGDYGRECTIGVGQGKRPILITEPDIASLLQAKAAIAAGILVLLGRANLEPSAIRTLYLAGGFGMHLRLNNAIACGLLPGFRPEQIQLVGNTSLAGATLAAIDASVFPELTRIGTSTDIVELNADPSFEEVYIDNLVLAGP